MDVIQYRRPEGLGNRIVRRLMNQPCLNSHRRRSTPSVVVERRDIRRFLCFRLEQDHISIEQKFFQKKKKLFTVTKHNNNVFRFLNPIVYTTNRF